MIGVKLLTFDAAVLMLKLKLEAARNKSSKKDLTGCPISKFPLCFCHFLGFWSTYRGTSDLYSTALEICYMIGTRILKIDLEIAEIIEVKVGTRHFEIDILLLNRAKNFFWCYRCQL